MNQIQLRNEIKKRSYIQAQLYTATYKESQNNREFFSNLRDITGNKIKETILITIDNNIKLIKGKTYIFEGFFKNTHIVDIVSKIVIYNERLEEENLELKEAYYKFQKYIKINFNYLKESSETYVFINIKLKEFMKEKFGDDLDLNMLNDININLNKKYFNDPFFRELKFEENVLYKDNILIQKYLINRDNKTIISYQMELEYPLLEGVEIVKKFDDGENITFRGFVHKKKSKNKTKDRIITEVLHLSENKEINTHIIIPLDENPISQDRIKVSFIGDIIKGNFKNLRDFKYLNDINKNRELK